MRIQVVCGDDIITTPDTKGSKYQATLNELANKGLLIVGHFLYIKAKQYKIIEVNVDADHGILFIYLEFIKN